MPPEQDLTDFFERVESAIEALAPEVTLEALSRAHLSVVGPVVFGDPVWDLFRKSGFGSWFELQSAVEERFGLRPAEVRAAFLASRPLVGEDPA